MDIFEQVTAHFAERKWPMQKMEGENILSCPYNGTHGTWAFVVTCDDDVLVMFARAPRNCPPDYYDEVTAFMNRANFGMTHGAWVMDRTDGEIRFRVGADLGGLTPDSDFFQRMTLYTNFTMDKYLPGFTAVINDDATYEEAFAIVFPE
ncbi:MAG: hypothetical protein RLZZ165_1461 [Bacteroidota bacterium]